MIDRDHFWLLARPIFGAGPNQSQVNGTNKLLDAWEAKYPAGDRRWCANTLAQSFWESAHTMQAVREAYYLDPPGQDPLTGPAEAYRRRLRYYPFYGRGLIQNTWEDNYRKMSPVVGRDLVAHPDDALLPDVSIAIALHGMEHGTFTGRKLADYFGPTVDDPLHARQIVNGMDQAAAIEALHFRFLRAVS